MYTILYKVSFKIELISLQIFGFLNMAVWAANLWFLFKETKWFQGGETPPMAQQQQQQQMPPQDPNVQRVSTTNITYQV